MKSELDVRVTTAFGLVLFAMISFLKGGELAEQLISAGSTAITLTVLLRLLFRKWIWKLWALRWLESVHGVPYIEGNWVGSFKSTGNDRTPIDRLIGSAELEIRQPNIDTVRFVRRSNESVSRSFGETIIKDTDGSIEFVYFYRSEPSADVQSRSAISYGAARLSLARESGLKLQGNYWTDQKTTGTLIFEKKK